MLDHFDAIAGIYDKVLGPPDPAPLRERLRLPAAGWLLDMGGGTGRVSHQLRPLVGNLVINDLSRGMLEQARSKGALLPLEAPAEALPFPDASFERVLVVDALHHFGNHRQAIGEALRVLRPGGRLLIEEPNVERLGIKLVALAEKLALMRSHFLPPADIAAIVTSFGYRAHIENEHGHISWVVVDT
jgi:demethylmenaquinone methyltransferase/2-methoxy-6-polyprenyl-1,4-benzoquinol methylase